MFSFIIGGLVGFAVCICTVSLPATSIPHLTLATYVIGWGLVFRWLFGEHKN